MQLKENQFSNRKTIWQIAIVQFILTAVLVAATMIFHRFFDKGFPAWFQSASLLAPILLAGTILTYFIYRYRLTLRHPFIVTLIVNPLTIFTLSGILFTGAGALYAPAHYAAAYNKNKKHDKNSDSLYQAQRSNSASDFGRNADSLIMMYLHQKSESTFETINYDSQGRVIEIKLNLGDSAHLRLIGELAMLKRLHLAGPAIDTLPPSFTHLTHLTDLRVENMNLRKLPSSLIRLKNLKFLSANINRIDSFPAQMPESLEEIYLNSNRIISLPSSLFDLKDLKRLELAGNSLENVPTAIGKLTNLEHLNLAGNKITKLPIELGTLSRLQHLFIQSNQLTSIPESVTGLKALTDFQFADNPIQERTLSTTTVSLLDKFSPSWRRSGSNYTFQRFWDDLGVSLIGERLTVKKTNESVSNDNDFSVLKFNNNVVERALNAVTNDKEICSKLGVISYESLGSSGLIRGLFYTLHNIEMNPGLVTLLTNELKKRIREHELISYNGILSSVQYSGSDDSEIMRQLEPFYLFWIERKIDGTFDLVSRLLMVICNSCSSMLDLADTLVTHASYESHGDSIVTSSESYAEKIDDQCGEPVQKIRNEIQINCHRIYELSCYFKYSNELPDSSDPVRDSISKERSQVEELTFNQILCLKKNLEKPPVTSATVPNLSIPDSDVNSKLRKKLPKAKPSEFLKDNPFFILGAGPFLKSTSQHDKAKIYKSLTDQPELRMVNKLSRNTNQVLNMILGRDSGATTINFGGPVPFGNYEECHI